MPVVTLAAVGHAPGAQFGAGARPGYLQLGSTRVEVVYKDITHIHLSVHPPLGAVRIAAPLRMPGDAIRVFAISKLVWIRQQQQRLQAQARETPREHIERESHYVWGRRYLLTVQEQDAAPLVALQPRQLVLRVRPGTSVQARQAVLAQWYRQQIRAALPALLAQWTAQLAVPMPRVFVQQMKTKWGSCNPSGPSIRLNTELAKQPAQCLEYVVVHELIHLLERPHNARFTALLDAHLPQWRQRRALLSNAALSHQTWAD